MSKDVNIHIKTPGADESKRKLDGVGEAAQKVGESVKRGGDRGADGMDKLGRATSSAQGRFGKFVSSMASWVAGIASIAAAIAAVTKVVRINKQALEEHGNVAVQQQQKLLSLQFLNSFFKERPELRKDVEAYSEFGRRPFEEVAEAWYNLRSKSGGLSQKQQGSIMTEALEMGRTTPETPLATLIDMISLYAKKTGQRDANRIQNVLQQTITEAGGTGGDVARYMPRFLPVGMAGGLSGAETAGLWAYATTQTSDPSVATTGLQAVFMGLQGKGSSESQKMLRQYGIKADMDFFQKIDRLSKLRSTGQFGLAEAEQLAGREGAAVMLSMLQNPEAMMQTVENVVAADRGDMDLTGSMIEELMAQDPTARAEEDIRRDDVAIQNLKGGSRKALAWRAHLRRMELQMRTQGKSEANIRTRLSAESLKGAFGYGPGELDQSLEDAVTFGDEPRVITRAYGEGEGGYGSTVIHNYHNEIIYNPVVGDPNVGPRAGADDVY